MRFKIGRAEVVRRRQNGRLQCNENWEDYDNEIMKNHVKNIGCRPLYFSSSLGGKDVPICSTREQMKRAQFNLRTDGYGVLPPCTSMEEISYEYEESTIESKDVADTAWDEGKVAKEGLIFLGMIFFNPNFKDIVQTRYVMD